MSERLGMIFTEEELKRMRIINNKRKITVDLHQLTVKQAKRLLNNLIAVNRDGFTIKVIHGYIHGSKIKEMVRDELSNKRIKARINIENNPGVTILKLSKTA